MSSRSYGNVGWTNCFYFFYALFKYSNVQLSSVSSNSINIELSQFCSWRRKKIHKKDLFNVDVVSPRQQ